MNTPTFPRQTGFFRRTPSGLKKHSSIDELFNIKRSPKRRFLLIGAHPDDNELGGGPYAYLLRKAGHEVFMCDVTDGSQGRWGIDEIDSIVKTRHDESIESSGVLGVPEDHCIFLDFPDGALGQLRGRRKACSMDRELWPHLIHEVKDSLREVHAYIGLWDSLTRMLRKIQPTDIIIPTNKDLHPDHVTLVEELFICLFHSEGKIWEECGKRLLRKTPNVYLSPVYCRLEQESIEIKLTKRQFDVFIRAAGCFRSQGQIERLQQNLRSQGPSFHLEAVNFEQFFNNRLDASARFHARPR